MVTGGLLSCLGGVLQVESRLVQPEVRVGTRRVQAASGCVVRGRGVALGGCLSLGFEQILAV